MENINVEQLFGYIPSLEKSSKIDPITKGYSHDQKFIVTGQNQQKMLLRLMDIAQYESKKEEYRHLEILKGYGVNCPDPIDIGRIPEQNTCYMLLSYMEGEDAAERLPEYDEHIQYQIGVDAGQDLARIHQYRAPKSIASWYNVKSKKNKQYVDAYRECGIKFPYEQQVLDYIEENIKYMKDRPNLFQHDDFTCSNVIVKDKKYGGVIDFGRYDWGDPIHEFLKIGLFSTEISVPFSIGQIKGYYKQGIPEYFWRLYTLYIAMAVISSIVWNNKFFPEENGEMLNRLIRVAEEHKGFTEVKPSWFRDFG